MISKKALFKAFDRDALAKMAATAVAKVNPGSAPKAPRNELKAPTPSTSAAAGYSKSDTNLSGVKINPNKLKLNAGGDSLSTKPPSIK